MGEGDSGGGDGVELPVLVAAVESCSHAEPAGVGERALVVESCSEGDPADVTSGENHEEVDEEEGAEDWVKEELLQATVPARVARESATQKQRFGRAIGFKQWLGQHALEVKATGFSAWAAEVARIVFKVEGGNASMRKYKKVVQRCVEIAESGGFILQKNTPSAGQAA